MYPLTLLFGFTLSLATTALAHATLVLGELQSDPVTPHAGEPFRLTLEMEDVIQTPVAGAEVYAEFRPEDASNETDPVLRERFSETQEGHYEVELAVPGGGAWALTLRDQTYRWEDATTTLTFYVSAEPTASVVNPAAIDFVFPPTATGPSGSVLTWIVWLVVIPIVAGGVVTVTVLRGGRQPPPGTPETQG